MYPYYSAELLQERARINSQGSFRERVRFDLVERVPYVSGVLAAADIARFSGIDSLTLIEFGVAQGTGLRNLCDVAQMVTEETGVTFRIVGFDNANGLPPLTDYRDHPEIWSEGDFPSLDPRAIEASLPHNASVIWGDIAKTVPEFVQTLTPEQPLGFISCDVVMYRSTMDALKIYRQNAEMYLPVSIAYFDDTLGNPVRFGSAFRTKWAGQLLAIDDFNKASEHTKIDELRILKYRKPMMHEQWLAHMYGVHRLDHPLRQQQRTRSGLTMREHVEVDFMHWPL